MNWLYLKHRLVGTPLQRPAEVLRWLMGAPQRHKHPELKDIYAEDARAHRIMKQLVTPDANCIDIGSHIGSVLATMTALAPRGTHFAFEPVPMKSDWLRRKFPRVKVFQNAVGDRPGEVTFSINVTRPGFSGMAKPQRSRKDQWHDLTVGCVRLDDVIPGDVHINFIKIDVEGAEVMALRGGQALIDRCQPGIIFESSPAGAKAFGMTHRDIFDLLTQTFGYEIYFFKDYLAGQSPTDWARFDEAHRYPFTAFNFLALPAARQPGNKWADTPTATRAIA